MAEAPPTGDLTVLLTAWRAGDLSAMGRLVGAVQSELMRMAGARLRGHDVATLAGDDVVNEALLRLMQHPADWQNRSHFFAIASLTMRSVLREHARARQTAKRDGGQRVQLTLAEGLAGEEDMAADVLTLDALLDQLARHDPRAAQVLEMTYFGGLERAQVAQALAVSVPTVDRELRFARAWLQERLGRDLEA